MEPIRGDALRGHLQGLILSVLERGDAHGFEVLQRLEQAGSGALALKEGSLYPALYNLEAGGMIKGKWENEAVARRGPRRRVYRLTAKGARRLEKARGEFRQIVNVIGGIFRSNDMNELIIQVERIVRPVRAVESRKLRMRRELLAHLQAAYDEELGRGLDHPAAVQRAIARLGTPAELTNQLQHSVPRVERLLLARLPVSRAVERWEVQAAHRMYGITAITMLHTAILAGAAGFLSGIPSYAVAPVQTHLTHTGGELAHPGLFFVGILLVWQIVFVLSCRFVMRAAEPHEPFNLRQTCRRAAAVIASQIIFTLVAMGTAFDRLPTLSELARNLSLTVLLLLCSLLIARLVAVRRRPYSEWLSLDLSE